MPRYLPLSHLLRYTICGHTFYQCLLCILDEICFMRWLSGVNIVLSESDHVSTTAVVQRSLSLNNDSNKIGPKNTINFEYLYGTIEYMGKGMRRIFRSRRNSSAANTFILCSCPSGHFVRWPNLKLGHTRQRILYSISISTFRTAVVVNYQRIWLRRGDVELFHQMDNFATSARLRHLPNYNLVESRMKPSIPLTTGASTL